ncbi:hypothetical protein FUA23_09535 [Neolewinella aurantiaca]|uniref:CopG family transcriptional regulator n=1 Tax=Neolewinella aurantiaca TaxID=2602767 RepID=A0A5C7FEV0_9BACT|nr:hypothetical protein [Neolewinella aurantiaca]TXF89682.1 hypothetical protein FUA23_09535 [Neolewinella aurantiaca]
MKTISLKLDDGTFQETEQLVGKLKLARNRYINEAVAYYNRKQRRELLEQQLAFESELCREDSMQVLNDTEAAVTGDLNELLDEG